MERFTIQTEEAMSVGTIISFIIGLIIGAATGVVLLAVLNANHLGDGDE